MEEIFIDGNTKNVALYVDAVSYNSKWLILVSNVCENKINYFFCMDINSGTIYCDVNGDKPWGNIMNNKFYLADKKQKLEMVNELRKRGYKYVPVLNKLVKKV